MKGWSGGSLACICSVPVSPGAVWLSIMGPSSCGPLQEYETTPVGAAFEDETYCFLLLPVHQSLLEFVALVQIKGSELRIDRDVLRHVSFSVCAVASMHVDSRM